MHLFKVSLGSSLHFYDFDGTMQCEVLACFPGMAQGQEISSGSGCRLGHTCLPADSRAVVQVHGVHFYHCLHHRAALFAVTYLNNNWWFTLKGCHSFTPCCLEPEDIGNVSFFLHGPLRLLVNSVFSGLCYPMSLFKSFLVMKGPSE